MMRPVHRSSLAAIWLTVAAPLAAQTASGTLVYPDATWATVDPESRGWSFDQLAAAREYSGTIGTAAVMVVYGGEIVDEWGDTSRPYMCHSMRKSILSALYGIHVAAGHIDLDKTMRELGIDDREPSLTDIEKGATVRQLLQARSGIYHPALYETAAMAKARPKRGSHAPGTFWYYNNWDFNALGTIFENCTGRGIYEEFERLFAKPLGMQDFDREKHTGYYTGEDSVHPAYPFRLSARDLARFGLLFARGGKWRDRQIVPADWVEESTRCYSEAGGRGGYGYMWWTSHGGRFAPGREWPDGCFAAQGAGGHWLLVVPQWDLVLVHRVDTDQRDQRVSVTEFGELAKRILAAMPEDAGQLRR